MKKHLQSFWNWVSGFWTPKPVARIVDNREQRPTPPKAPSIEELEALSDEEIHQLMLGVRRQKRGVGCVCDDPWRPQSYDYSEDLDIRFVGPTNVFLSRGQVIGVSK